MHEEEAETRKTPGTPPGALADLSNRPARMVECVVLLTTALIVTACVSEPELQFADWLLDVPQGATVHEYPAAPIEGRDPDAVQMTEDLVIGGDLTNPEAVLYEPGEIVADDDGTIFVADGGAMNIKVFDAAGEFLKTVGQEGQGPAEFGRVSQMTIAGDQLVIYDSRNRRFSLWTLDGEHVTEHAPTTREFFSSIEGVANGNVVAMVNVFDPEGESRLAVVRRSTTGEDLGTVYEVTLPETESVIERSDPRGTMQRMIDSLSEPRLSYTLTDGDHLFVTPGHEYQVLALSGAGDIGWALRVAWPRVPYSDYLKASMVESLARVFQSEGTAQGEAAMSPDDFNWSAPYPALRTLLTDDSGRLYVFPAVPQEGEQRPETLPVDVYSAEGEFLAAGIVPNTWRYARGEYVYGTRPDGNDELVVVRYRLSVNGQ